MWHHLFLPSRRLLTSPSSRFRISKRLPRHIQTEFKGERFVSSSSSSSSSSSLDSSSFGVVFDIDGVLLRGGQPLLGAHESLSYLQSREIPFVFLTNGGGVPEKVKCSELNKLLNSGNNTSFQENQVILSHTPMKELVEKYENQLVLVVGCKDYIGVAKEYGFKKIITVNDFLHLDGSLYPFRKYENLDAKDLTSDLALHERVAAILILHDPTDWAPEIQVLSDIVLQNGDILSQSAIKIPSKNVTLNDKVKVYTSNPDLIFASTYKSPRLAQGAFVEAWRAVLKNCYNTDLDIVTYGKPLPKTYRYTEKVLVDLLCTKTNNSLSSDSKIEDSSSFPLRTIYAIGDNPKSDIEGANTAKNITTKWVSILVRSGVFQGENDPENPADYVVDGVGDALDLIKRLEEMT